MIALLALALAQEPGNPDLKWIKEQGFSIMKPPKNEEWGFRDKAFYADSKAVVGHKVDTLTIEVLSFNVQNWDAKKQAEAELAKFTGNAKLTITNKKDLFQSKLPGGAASGARAWAFEVDYKPEGGVASEARLWTFPGRENQNGFIVLMVGDAGMYKKHQKAADYILSSIKTWKIPK